MLASLAAVALIASLVAADEQPCCGEPACITVAFTSTSNELTPELPQQGRDAITEVALRDGYAEILVGEGNGTVQARPRIDLTPRRQSGEREKVKNRRERIALENTEIVAEAVRVEAAAEPGHAALALIQEIGRYACKTVVLVTSGINTRPPLDLRHTGWDVPPGYVVEQLRAADALPRLAGKTVILAITPPAGTQEPLSEPVKRHLERLLTELLESSGAELRLVPSASSKPPVATRTVPPVPVPDQGPIEPVANPSCPEVETVRLPAVTFFFANQARLLDPAQAREALEPLADRARRPAASISIELIGHTSLDADGREAGQVLSRERAETIADLLVEELGVPRDRIVKVTGVGPTQPLVEPPDDPGNRAVEVILKGKEATCAR